MSYDSFIPNSSKCINWTGTISKRGYAVCYKNFKQYRVARILMIGIYGDFDRDLVVDHICNNTKCVNVSHLQIITTKQNVLRGNGISANNARKTRCKYGHALSGENLKIKGGNRSCRLCDRFYSNRSKGLNAVR